MTKQRKYILIAGSLLLLIGAVYRFYPFGFAFLDGTSNLAFQQKKIAKYRVAVKQKPYIDKHLQALKKTADQAANQFLRGSTPALAAVDIQNTLNSIAEKVGISISRMDIQKEKKIEENNLVSIQVMFRIRSTTRQLRDLIYYLESSEKLIRIIDIRANVQRNKVPEEILSGITVEGFIRE